MENENIDAPVNPVRNSSGASNPVRDLSLSGINPAGIILKSQPEAGQPLADNPAPREGRGIISNGVKAENVPAPTEPTEKATRQRVVFS